MVFIQGVGGESRPGGISIMSGWMSRSGIYDGSKGCYGSPKITRELQDRGRRASTRAGWPPIANTIFR